MVATESAPRLPRDAVPHAICTVPHLIRCALLHCELARGAASTMAGITIPAWCRVAAANQRQGQHGR